MNEKEICQYMDTGLTRQQAIEEIKYWNKVSGMFRK